MSAGVSAFLTGVHTSLTDLQVVDVRLTFFRAAFADFGADFGHGFEVRRVGRVLDQLRS